MTNARPGWFPDGTGIDRWWDGEEWTDDTRETPPTKRASNPPTYAPAAPASQGQTVQGAVTAGWLLAIFLSPLGFVVGLFLIGKTPEAGKIIGVSVLIMCILYFVAVDGSL